MGFGAFGWASWGSPERYELPSVTSDGSAADFDRQVLAVKNLFDLGLIRHWALSNPYLYPHHYP